MDPTSLIFGRSNRFRFVILVLCFATAILFAASRSGSADDKPHPHAHPAEVPATNQKVEFLPTLDAAERRIQAELERPTDIAFSDTPLTEAISYWSEFHKIPIILDTEALDEEVIPLDSAVTRTLEGVKLRSVLNIVLRPMKMAYVIEDEVLKITTRAQAERCLTTRVYPIADLCSAEGGAKPLVVAIQKTVATNWETDEPPLLFQKSGAPAPQPPKRGLAKMVAVEKAGSLIVTQTYDGHQQVLQLLRMLREAKNLGCRTQSTVTPASANPSETPAQPENR